MKLFKILKIIIILLTTILIETLIKYESVLLNLAMILVGIISIMRMRLLNVLTAQKNYCLVMKNKIC